MLTDFVMNLVDSPHIEFSELTDFWFAYLPSELQMI